MQKGKIKINNKKGYTIIETMIAVSLFIVIVTMGLTALLNANLIHGKSRNMRSIMDNLNFILDDMSKNMRTGTTFHCFTNGESIVIGNTNVPKSCSSGWGISFESANGSTSSNADQWVYYIGSDNKIYKSTDGSTTSLQLTPDEVVIDTTASTFSVLGAGTSVSGDQQQPLIGIRLVGKITYKNVDTPFSLQTSVSQRLIDVGTPVASSSDTIWFDDALPAGAVSQQDAFNWVASGPSPFSGTLANKSQDTPGNHQQYFTGASSSFALNTGDKLVAYVYLSTTSTPSEVMLQWNNGSWEHRAYWGTDNITWGTNNTDSRRYMGALPVTGQWVRLEVPASSVGLEGSAVSGMAFTLFGGQATWDHAGKTP